MTVAGRLQAVLRRSAALCSLPRCVGRLSARSANPSIRDVSGGDPPGTIRGCACDRLESTSRACACASGHEPPAWCAARRSPPPSAPASSRRTRVIGLVAGERGASRRGSGLLRRRAAATMLSPGAWLWCVAVAELSRSPPALPVLVVVCARPRRTPKPGADGSSTASRGRMALRAAVPAPGGCRPGQFEAIAEHERRLHSVTQQPALGEARTAGDDVVEHHHRVVDPVVTEHAPHATRRVRSAVPRPELRLVAALTSATATTVGRPRSDRPRCGRCGRSAALCHWATSRWRHSPQPEPMRRWPPSLG